MDRLFNRSQYFQDEQHVNAALTPYGLTYGAHVAVDGQMVGGVAFARVDAVEIEYVAPYEKRTPRIGVLLAIPFEDGSGVHRMYSVERVSVRS